jgi:hypothetical protein
MMADIETSIVISANTDDLQSGMEAAANSVQAATDAIRAQFTGLGAAAQQVQLQVTTASAQVGSSIGALQARAAGLAGSIGDGLIPSIPMGGRSANQLAAQNERDQLNLLSADQKVTDAKFANYKALIDDEAALGQISVNQQIRQEQDLLDLKWSYDQAYYEKKLVAAQDDTRTQEKLIEEQALAYEKYVGQVQTLDTKLAEANQKVWDDLVAPVERAIDTSVTGIILGTTTVQKALANLAQSIIAEFVNSAVKGVFGQIGSLFGASLLGAGDQDFSGGLTGAGEEVAGGGLAESIGLGGLFSAGGSSLGSLFKGIGSLFGFERGGIVPSAQGGWAVPSLGPGGVLAQLHSNEMVLPANISQGFQNLIAAPYSANATGGGSPIVVNFGVSAMDSQDVARFFRSNGSALVAAINNAMRNGSALRAS